MNNFKIDNPWAGIDNPFGAVQFSSVEAVLSWITSIMDYIIGLSALVCVGIMIYGGILYITSAGDPDKTKEAQGTITNGIIGMVICFLAGMIIKFVLEKIL